MMCAVLDRLFRPGLMLGLSGLLLACAAEHSPAPVDDRSTVLERQSPIIAPRGETGPQPEPRGASRQVQVADTTAVEEDVDEPADTPEVSPAVVGSPATTVQGARVGGGISRQQLEPIRRQTLPGASEEPTRDTGADAARDEVYTVQQGDTLYSIAWMHDMDHRRLAAVNRLSEPFTIYPGQELSVVAENVGEREVRALDDIPAAPAGASAGTGERPRAAMEQRRTSVTATRQVDGVSWQWPADGRILARFGDGAGRGVDLAQDRGSPVYAVADGDVVYAGRGIQGAGNLVILRHSGSHLSAYMYNSNMLVREGDRVRAGDRIASSGEAPDGRELLHFEIRVDGQAADPDRFLPRR